jgi:hypothetical protein
MNSQVAYAGPYRKIVETVGFYITYLGRTLVYQLECGHEVERRQANRTACYCELCPMREGR